MSVLRRFSAALGGLRRVQPWRREREAQLKKLWHLCGARRAAEHRVHQLLPTWVCVSNMNTVHAHALSTLGDFSARDRVLSKLVFRAQYVSSAVQLRDQGLRLLGRCFTPPFLQFLPKSHECAVRGVRQRVLQPEFGPIRIVPLMQRHRKPVRAANSLPHPFRSVSPLSPNSAVYRRRTVRT